MREKPVKLNKIEKCLIILARHIERLPYCEFRIEEQILEELGYEKAPPLPLENEERL